MRSLPHHCVTIQIISIIFLISALRIMHSI